MFVVIVIVGFVVVVGFDVVVVNIVYCFCCLSPLLASLNSSLARPKRKTSVSLAGNSGNR